MSFSIESWDYSSNFALSRYTKQKLDDLLIHYIKYSLLVHYPVKNRWGVR